MSRSVELADAIAAKINESSGDFPIKFVVRRWAPLTETELESANIASVLVFPGSIKSDRVTRRSHQKSYLPIVAVQKHLRATSDSDADQELQELHQLVEQIQDALTDADFTFDDWSASFVGFEQEQYAEVYNAEAMQSFNFFASATELEYTSG